MRKNNANLDKKILETNYLPSDILWRAAQLVNPKGMEATPIETEPAPRELLGLAIGILRRQKRMSRSHIAQKTGCTVEELLALEMGLLPVSDFEKYLPLILHVIDMPEKALQPFLVKIKYA